eukprot:gene671-80_t
MLSSKIAIGAISSVAAINMDGGDKSAEGSSSANTEGEKNFFIAPSGHYPLYNEEKDEFHPMPGSKNSVSFGLIGDVQYADVDDGFDFSGVQRRYFRGTLDCLKRAVEIWRKENVDFVVQVGDIIDGRNNKFQGKVIGESQKALDRVLEAFNALPVPRYDMAGNHEFYNFTRKELVAQKENNELFSFMPKMDGDGFYYLLDVNNGDSDWRIIVLDPYQVSTEGFEEGDKRAKAAKDILKEHNPQCFAQADVKCCRSVAYVSFGGATAANGIAQRLQEGTDWFKGVPDEKLHYVAFNGALGDEQMQWFKDTLAKSREDKKSVIVMSHIPVLKGSCSVKTVTFDHKEIQQVLADFKDIVKIFIAGHDHDGGFKTDDAGIPHATMYSPMLVGGEKDCCAIVTLTSGENAQGKIKFYGHALPAGNFKKDGSTKAHLVKDGEDEIFNELIF